MSITGRQDLAPRWATEAELTPPETATLFSSLSQLANSPVIKCFSSCAAFSTQVSVACSGEAIFTESTFLECLCQDSKVNFEAIELQR